MMNVKRDVVKYLAKATYKELDNKVKSSAKKDKRKYIDNLAKVTKNAAMTGNSKTLHNISKIFSSTFSSRVKYKNGNLLTSSNDQNSRWAEHFKEILNRPHPIQLIDFDINRPTPQLYINMNEFTMSEIEAAVKLMANNKATGEDDITAEMLKAIQSQSVGLFNKIWQKEKVPSKWKRGIIIKIPKKCNLSECNN
jgi:hypothetical protein